MKTSAKIVLIIGVLLILILYISFAALVIEQYNQIPKDVKKTEKDGARYWLAILSLIAVIIIVIILFGLIFSYGTGIGKDFRKGAYRYALVNSNEIAEEAVKTALEAKKVLPVSQVAALAGAEKVAQFNNFINRFIN
jgi:hypothetical protein